MTCGLKEPWSGRRWGRWRSRTGRGRGSCGGGGSGGRFASRAVALIYKLINIDISLLFTYLHQQLSNINHEVSNLVAGWPTTFYVIKYFCSL